VRRLPGWRAGLDSSYPRGAGERGELPKEKAHPRSSRRAAGGYGATGGPRCHGWQRGPGTQPFVVQGLIGPRKARCHVATHFKAGNEVQTDQDRQRQSNALAQADSQSAARKNGTHYLLPTRSGGTRNLPKEMTHSGSVETLIGDAGSQTRFGNRPAGNSVSRVRQAPAKRSFAEKVPKPSLGTRGSTEPRTPLS
jgi:hypothetical protein